MSWLEREFSLEEIKKATFELPKDKGLAPGGFFMCFFQECWETLRNNILLVIINFFFPEFHSNEKLPRI